MEEHMSLAKVIEVMSEGKTMEEAVENAIKQASETVSGIKGLYIENIQVIVEDNKISKYRLDCKITFVLEHKFKT